MRKITFLWALLLCTGAAFAQIGALSELSNEKAYLLHNANNLGYAWYNAGKTTSSLWLAEATAISGGASSKADASYGDDLDKTKAAAYFQVLNVGGKYYLYSLGAKKFVKTKGGSVELTETATPITIEALTGGGFAFNTTPSEATWYMCAATHLNPPVQFWYKTDAGSAWEIIECTETVADMPDFSEAIAKASSFDVTYNYTVTDADNYTFTRVVNQNIGTAYDPTMDFLANYQYTAGTVVDGDNVVNVTCTTNFPFVPATLTDGALGADTHWYMLDVNNNANYFVYTDDIAVKADGAATDAEAYYWAFVRKAGTYNEFSLYNMKTGAAAPLTIQWTEAWNGSTTQPYNQSLATMATGGSNTTTFRVTANGNGFNLQIPETGINNVFPANLGRHINENFGIYQGSNSSSVDMSRLSVKNECVGTAESLLAARKAMYDAKTAGFVGSYTAEQLAALNSSSTLADFTENLAGYTPIAIEAGKYYRIVSAAVGDELRAPNAMIYANLVDGSYKTYWKEGTNADMHAIWKFEATTNGSNQAGYKIKNVNTGTYIGSVAGGSVATPMVAEGSATVYRTGTYDGVLAQHYFTRQTNATIGFSDKVSFLFSDLNASNGGLPTVCGWEGGANSNSAWYIVPATEIEVAMNSVDNTYYYSTLYLPFGATPQDASLKVYRAQAGENVMTLETIEGGVPAETGVILEGTKAEYVLNIDDNVPELTEQNDLGGTCKVIDGIAKADYYILGAMDGEVGFYHPNAESLKANRAYYKPAGASAASVLSFVFGGATGVGQVETIATEPATSVYYDLSGRRVLRPGKGVYVKDGRKVYIR